MKLTKFTLYRNTPFLDFMNTIHFASNEKREAYFDKHYTDNEVIYFDQDFNYVRDRLKLKVMLPYEKFDGINYCRFISQRDNKEYYAFVANVHYLTDIVTEITLVIDPIMSFTQGNILENVNNVQVIRQHLDNENYQFYLPYLKMNDDVLKTVTKKYVHQQFEQFNNFMIVFQSSCDLSKDFGTVDDPKIKASKGTTYDEVSSPIDLYIASKDDFEDIKKALSDYPWIAQNLKAVLMIPTKFVDETKLKNVSMYGENSNVTGLKTFNKNAVTKNITLDSLKMSYEQLATRYNINLKKEEHLLRSEYTTLELYTYTGQSLLLDTGLLDAKTGLEMKSLATIGYQNEIRIYPKNYNTTDKESVINNGKGQIAVDKGSFLNNSLLISNFNEIPVLIDNYKLSMANTANQRNLAESKLLTNRVDNMLNGNDKQSRFFDAVSVLSDVSMSAVMGKFTDEYEFYRNQKAQFKDMALQAPSITNQNNNNANPIKNGYYGISLKLSCPNVFEMNKVRNYYNLFGFEFNEIDMKINKIDSMTVCNYLQFKGQWQLDNVDVNIMEQLRIQMENGVRFWHDNGTKNPMKKSILSNERVK